MCRSAARRRRAARPGSPLELRVGTSVAEVERALILATLDELKGNKRDAARTLGLSLKTLYNRLKEYGR